MPLLTRHVAAGPLLVTALALAAPAMGQDADALSLTSAPAETTKGGSSHLFVEGAAGRGDDRLGPGWQNLGRFTVDMSSSQRFAPDWQAVVSDRLDVVHPVQLGSDKVVNSLREAYVSWQRDGGSTVVDLGRVNLRYGPAYGYNPTDFFRDNTVRVVTTADPLALRQTRLGTFVLRGQQVWGDNAASFAYAPKLADAPSTSGWNLDAGATNDRDRSLLTFSTRLGARFGGQLLFYKEGGLPPSVGASATALVTDSVVAYAEGTRGREPSLLARAQGFNEPRETRNRLSTGLTYTPVPKLSITGEYEYNGFAADRPALAALRSAGPQAALPYLVQAVDRQEISSRQAWMVYASAKDAALRNLDVTALLRINGDDHSRLGWVELRYHWPSFDVALQLQQQGGSQVTEFGILPFYRSVQLLATYHLF